ncbi:DEHA2B02948p [Debaryomyces hansenii CBS767]|uniref:DEHA2B02948p n=1 Tax=Debaryomyces hansenii (strain ATCC 36239 / CBS 767 / BCRC 21394 / JCM 1990 / NBRC 0083 / IGC 2968) TaxID=284592 RepID=B5RT33_DEBHA|nr:DEHA2B02948p [Debaryomyces hansenii CBS767]CAR65438.1 DEHA2B02948p [Debaryomyces hansenii CBS767]|eukprot:XP_002770068.1 DEHA2B02948p [Debaryomyces hansenii CBS767]
MSTKHGNIKNDMQSEGQDSESDVDSLTEDLDQIGRLNLSMPLNLNLSLSSYINNIPNLPAFDIRNLRNLPKVQEFSNEISRYISTYKSNSSDIEAPAEVQQTTINSMKTAISTRIQMHNFLNDLDLGLSLATAIDRLQPLTNIIHETIFLPAEDTSDFEDDYDIDGERESENHLNQNSTEPVGVDAIVNRHQPFVSDIVKPDNEGSHSSNYKQRRKRHLHGAKCFSDEDSATATGSDLDNVEGLSIDEVKALTDLSSLDDFYQESLLRRKIQKIQGLDNLSQTSKNKLVTRLMMGNYYKYVNENLAKNNMSLSPNLKKQQLVLNEDRSSTPGRSISEVIMEDSERTDEHQSTSQEGRTESEVETVSEDDDDAVILTEKDQEPSYYDAPFNTIMGCTHYQRNCKVECPTCFKWYPCRFCHDSEITSHKLSRQDVKHILCMKCNTPQIPESNYCISCEAELANYFCLKCKLYDNDPTKDIYHCDKCGICRLGLGLGKDFYHCDECNICLSIDLRERHKCLTNTTHCNCPICNEYLFTSVNKVVFMKCGHSIHQACYDELSKHSYKCPVCKKTVVNVETQFRILDQEIRQSPLPSPYNLWRCIISCNDCKGKSNVPYHVVGLKCKYCKSYNTNQQKLIKPEEEEEEEDNQEEEDDDQTSNRLNPMRLIQTNLQSNFLIGENASNTPTEEDYDGDNNKNSDDSDRESDHEMFAKVRKLTNSIVSNLSPSGSGSNTSTISSQPQVSYITSILQGFVNNATKDNYISKSNTDSDATMDEPDVTNNETSSANIDNIDIENSGSH